MADVEGRTSRLRTPKRRVVPFAAGTAAVSAAVAAVAALLKQTAVLSTPQLVAVLGFGVTTGIVLGAFLLLYASQVSPERFRDLLEQMGPSAKIQTLVWSVETGERSDGSLPKSRAAGERG